jgi:hypothetical protein
MSEITLSLKPMLDSRPPVASTSFVVLGNRRVTGG